MLFKQDSFGGGSDYAERYKKECRDRYIRLYENITDTMRYKDYLSRIGKPWNAKGKNWATKAVDKREETDENHEMEEETEKERAALIKWEKQWWQKFDARICV